MPASATKTGKKRKTSGIRGRLKAHDPFELIRWLAFSQTDPRKALAELVQNSLDAQAKNVRISRYRQKGVSCLRILDDGEGVIPEMDRQEALRYIATHIGHSRKRSLSPQERLQLMTQGQYGIGLLGFWSLGETMEIRSSVAGQKPHRLVLHRNDHTFDIEPLPGRLPLDDRWTEIVITNVHPDAQRVLAPRRAAEYLASELRGQLLLRDVNLTIEDRNSRSRAQKRITVMPPRFLGEPIAGLDLVEVPNFPPIRLEIYWIGEKEEPSSRGICVYCAGSQVADGFHALASLGFDRPPWTDPRLTGLVDFPAFRIAPGSRRGVIVDDAAEAFALALPTVEPTLLEALRQIEERKAAELERSMIRDLQRAFRDFYRHRPAYSLLPVQKEKDLGASGAPGDVPGGVGVAPESQPLEDGNEVEAHLLPPGPLGSVRVRPKNVMLAPSDMRRVKATAVDATGRPVEEAVAFTWRLEGGVGSLLVDGADEERAILGGAGVVGLPVEAARAEGRRDSAVHELRFAEGPAVSSATLAAAPDCAEGWLRVSAEAESGSATTEVPIEITDDLPGSSKEGIPDPELVEAPGERWRSRIEESRWQVNAAHPDYREVDSRPGLKLRYLAMLFAKEVVVNDHQDPRLAQPLEQLVEVAAYADRRLAPRRKSRSHEDPEPDRQE
jgi:hypothetical protein